MSGRQVFALGAAALLAAVSAFALDTYFVDDAGGDDAHDGRSPAAAWRSLARVNGAELHPTDEVLFRRGGTWRGQLRPVSGAPGSNILYGAYGDGPKPLLLGSAALNHASDWRPAGPDLWVTAPVSYAPVGEAVAVPPARWSLHVEGGARLERQGLRLRCVSSGTARHHAQWSVSGLSVLPDHWYRLAFRLRTAGDVRPLPVSLMKAGAPWTAYAAPATLAPDAGTNWVEKCVIFRAGVTDEAARVTLFLGGALSAGADVEMADVTFGEVRPDREEAITADVGNIIFDGGAATGTKKWSVADLREEGDFVCTETAPRQVTLRCARNPAERFRSLELALTRHIIDQGGRGCVTYEDLDLRYGAAHGIGGGSTHDIVVRQCDFLFIGGGLQHRRPDGRPVRYGNAVEFWSSARDSVVEDCRLGEVYDAALTNQGSETNVQENITYRCNRIWNSEYSFEYWNRGEASHTRDIRFAYNVCVGAGRGWGHRQRPDQNGRHLMFYDNRAITTNVSVRRNLFCDAADSLWRLHGRDWTAALDLADNGWQQAAGPLLLWGQDAIDADAFPAFLAARGWRREMVLTDPLPGDPGAVDFHRIPAGPARDVLQGLPVRVLIVDGYSNHDWRRTTELVRGILAPTGLFQVSVSTVPTNTRDAAYADWRPAFTHFDVVIQNCNSLGGGPGWPAAARADFEQFVRAGGGVYVLHSGNNAFADWPEYNRMIGLGWRGKDQGWAVCVETNGVLHRIAPGDGSGTSHGARTDRVIHRLGDHPIHAGLPRHWLTPQIEVYTHARGPAENLTVLSWAEDPKTQVGWPIEWVVHYGAGRMYTSTFGHVWKNEADPVDMQCAGYQTLLVRALQWLAGRPVSWPVPSDFPTAAAVSLRPLH